MTEAIVVGYNRKKNETFAEVRVKSFCSGWVTQSRKKLGEMTMTYTAGGLLSNATASVNIFSNDSRPPMKIPLKVVKDDSRGGSKCDIEGFVKTCNDLIALSRNRGAAAEGGAVATAEVYTPYNSHSVQMVTATPVDEPQPDYSRQKVAPSAHVNEPPPDYYSIQKGER